MISFVHGFFRPIPGLTCIEKNLKLQKAIENHLPIGPCIEGSYRQKWRLYAGNAE